MDPFELDVTISRSRAEVFAYLQDIANHAEFTDHFLVRWHLTREDSIGQGAGARFFRKARFTRYTWADVTFAEVAEPRLIVERGRAGKYNRILTRAVWELEETHGGQSTRVSFSYETKPKLPSDRIMAAVLGERGRMKRKSRKAA